MTLGATKIVLETAQDIYVALRKHISITDRNYERSLVNFLQLPITRDTAHI